MLSKQTGKNATVQNNRKAWWAKGYFSLLTYISISVISAVSGPESLPSIPLKNVKQTNKQKQKQKQNLKKGGSVPIKFL